MFNYTYYEYVSLFVLRFTYVAQLVFAFAYLYKDTTPNNVRKNYVKMCKNLKISLGTEKDICVVCDLNKYLKFKLTKYAKCQVNHRDIEKNADQRISLNLNDVTNSILNRLQ